MLSSAGSPHHNRKRLFQRNHLGAAFHHTSLEVKCQNCNAFNWVHYLLLWCTSHSEVSLSFYTDKNLLQNPSLSSMHLYPLEESRGFFNCFTAATSPDPDNWSSCGEATVDTNRFDSILKGNDCRIAEKGKEKDFECID